MRRRNFDPDCGLDIATTTIREVDKLTAIRHWGYRVILHPDGMLFIHEAYYGDDAALLGIARKPAEPCAETHEELQMVLDDMGDALREPVLHLRDLLPDDVVG